MPDFEAKFVPDYDAGSYSGYLDHAENIRAAVGEDAVRAAFFLGHVEHIGLKSNGDMIDPAAANVTVASGGLTVWVQGDMVIGLEALDARPPQGALEALGAPEAVVPSELGSQWSQQLWGTRGLVIHRSGDRIRVAFGLAAFEPEEWEDDPLRWWRIERIAR